MCGVTSCRVVDNSQRCRVVSCHRLLELSAPLGAHIMTFFHPRDHGHLGQCNKHMHGLSRQFHSWCPQWQVLGLVHGLGVTSECNLRRAQDILERLSPAARTPFLQCLLAYVILHRLEWDRENGYLAHERAVGLLRKAVTAAAAASKFSWSSRVAAVTGPLDRYQQAFAQSWLGYAETPSSFCPGTGILQGYVEREDDPLAKGWLHRMKAYVPKSQSGRKSGDWWGPACLDPMARLRLVPLEAKAKAGLFAAMVSVAARLDEELEQHEDAGLAPDAETAAKAQECHSLYLELADAGHPLALVNLGTNYACAQGGVVTRRDAHKGFAFYKIAADKARDPLAMFLLAHCYYWGNGTSLPPSSTLCCDGIKRCLMVTENPRGREQCQSVLTDLAAGRVPVIFANCSALRVEADDWY